MVGCALGHSFLIAGAKWQTLLCARLKLSSNQSDIKRNEDCNCSSTSDISCSQRYIPLTGWNHNKCEDTIRAHIKQIAKGVISFRQFICALEENQEAGNGEQWEIYDLFSLTFPVFQHSFKPIE
jgi:hypothetical protein